MPSSVSIQQSIDFCLINLPLADFKFEIHQLISFFESSLINTIDSKLPKEFLKAETLFQCKDNTNIMVQKLDDLGYRINRKKSVLIPTKHIVFFGLIIDTEVFKVFLTDEKVDKISKIYGC
jgi:hypothetical protein